MLISVGFADSIRQTEFFYLNRNIPNPTPYFGKANRVLCRWGYIYICFGVDRIGWLGSWLYILETRSFGREGCLGEYLAQSTVLCKGPAVLGSRPAVLVCLRSARFGEY